MLKDYLPTAHIQLIEQIEDWQKAVQLCAEPLLNEGLIETRYIARIFQLHQEIGPYFVIAPQIAMPHARPEDGANAQALSLLVVKQGVDFQSENDPVNLIILLAAKNNDSHIEMLSAVAELLSDDKAVQSMIRADNTTQIENIISHY
ncbi:PTS sugar transporter subunit IIA [Aggregatibacter kilianii]|uniref:PTS sugar transporter subunit IIA n=1 Tax=Aggregatibacter kilianii TaxID=2025884 RepID=UPI000D64F49A|nr:PTS sugar transporter subunit IIA [Aggregatibacter kilianii]